MEIEGLSGICAGLGIAEEDENGRRIGYSTDENCSDNLRDLVRFLRRDDPQTRDVFKQLCKWNTVSKDLIPIIQFCQEDRSLVLNAVKVLVFLTMPIEPSSNDIPQQVEYLWGLKSAITSSETIVVILSLIESPLENLERESFTEDDWKLVQLVLTLFRNILAIQDISLPQKVGGSASELLSLRDKFLELLFRENVMDLIMVITQHVGGSYNYFRQDNLLLLDIFYYVFMGQDPELIANAHQEDAKVDGCAKASLDGLKSIMEQEKEKRKLSRIQNLQRHSQFSGTFTRLTMDGAKAVYKGNPRSASSNTLLKPQKVQRGATKRIMWDHGRLPLVKENILVLLHDFLNQFLTGAYNVLMQSIREDIEREHLANQNIMVFIEVAHFVTSFQYHKSLNSKPNMENDTSELTVDAHADSTLFKGDICGPIAASMNESMFQLVISHWRNAFDGLKETKDYKFLSAAGALLKIMIRILDLVLRLLPEDSKEPQTARILLYKLFYDQTDQGMTQFILSLIKSFDTHKQPKSDLADLVEIVHVIVRLMENLQARGTLRVSKKSRRGRKKKSPSEMKETGNEMHGDEAIIQNQSVLSIDEHSTQQEIQANALSDNQNDLGIAAQVDKPDVSAQEMGSGSDIPQMDKINHLDALSCSSDDSSGDEQPPATYEVDFKESTFVSGFANHSIIHNLCWLLSFYKSNSTRTNHYIICMLRRITDDLDLSPMLYQLSLLTKFYDILREQKSCPCKEYANIVDFLTSLIRRMLRKMKSQPLLFVEVLFWKSRRECHYINAEYLLHELGNMRKETATWGNVSANGEMESSQATGWVPRSLADALGEDEADVVLSHEFGKMSENVDEEQQDNAFISDSNPDGKEQEIERAPKRKRRLVLTDELETRIRDLYEKFKDDENCSRLIAESLDPDGLISPAQVFNKLKQLGLKVASRKRMRHVDRSLSANLDADEERSVKEKEHDLHDSADLEGNPLRSSLSKRKRVRAFSKDHDETIKALFEQFKDQKKCNHLIANALAADNSITAAQVSRKLKQLGLRVLRQKKSRTDVHLRDEEPNEISVEEGLISDDETLISLKKRRGNKDSQRLSIEELPSREKEEMSSDSDDELLSSVLKKTTKSLESKDTKLTTISVERKITDENSGDELLSEDGEERDEVVGTDEERMRKDIGIDHISKEGSLEVEISGKSSRNTPGASPIKNENDLPHPYEPSEDELADSEDELADSEDDAGPGSLMDNAVQRRKMRMVIDLEDDD